MQLLISVLVGKLFALIVGLYYLRYLSGPYRLALFTIALAAFAECYGRYIAVHMHQHNQWMFNFYNIIDFWLDAIIAFALINSKKIKTIFLIFIGIHAIVWTVEVSINSIYIMANMAMVSEFVFLTVMYFVVLFNNSVFTSKGILKQPVFWLSLSTILYCAPTIPYWGLHNYLIYHAPNLSLKLLSINTVLDALRPVIAAISFILLGRQRQLVLNTA